MPVELRRIGHHAQRVVVDLEDAADRLDHQRGACRIMERVVEGRHDPHRRLDDVDDRDVLGRLPHLGDSGEVGQRPGQEIPWRHRRLRVRRLGVGIADIAGEIEDTAGQPLFVHAVGEDR